MENYCSDSQTAFSGSRRTFSKNIVNLRDYFRLLWAQHVYWTRLVIIGIVYDLPNLEQTTNRLLCNAPDFGRVFGHFYGKECGSRFSRLIKGHLVIAAELVSAAKTGSSSAAAAAEKKWYANADEITTFLTYLNPYWPIGPMRQMWYKHLALTKEEAVAELGKNFAKGIETFNRIEAEAMMMADEFTNGIARQFRL